jgi:predicted nuclease of restriction endonuclease-like (RecB) superfamily
MKFNDLIQNIQKISGTLRKNAISAVNIHLTVRNWLIGFYIVEFEQKGEDRAKYGEKLLQNLAESFDEEGLSYRNLNLYRQFYLVYPQISVYIPHFFQKYFGGIWQSPSAKLGNSEKDNSILQSSIAELQSPEEENVGIGQSPIAQLGNSENDNSILQTVSAELQSIGKEFVGIGQTPSAQFSPDEVAEQLPYITELVSKLSFSHFSLLLPIEDPLKRRFYELECIKGTWSVRELKRQIDTLYFERSGISRKPGELSEKVQEKTEKSTSLDIIKSPFAFEFLGLKAKDVVYESDLEQALIEHLEEFLMELGRGFCFEARQKRIIIGDEYFFCDLVFYHRILKCHVLVELKVDSFSHEHIGQLKTYVNYYRKEIMQPDDNPPVGILLVTNKNSALVEYAVADSDRELFVSKYIVELPDKKQLEKFINEEYIKLK